MRPSLLLLAALLAASPAARAVDWGQYRGPQFDGTTPDGIRTDWNQHPPTVLWKKPLGPGWSSISVAAGRAITQAKRTVSGAVQEVVVALDAATGNELWATPVDTAVYSYGLSGSAPNALDGPRSTPSIVGDRVYVISSFLKVYCLNAATGEVIWLRDLVAESNATVIPWHNAASPLVVGDRLFLNSGIAGRRLTALRTLDGTTLWSGQADGSTHATAAYATLVGLPQVVFLTQNGLVGVTPETGSVLWRYSFAPSITSTAATPIVVGDLVYASCAYAKGAWTAHIVRNGDTFSATQTKFQQETQYQNHWATPVVHETSLYGIVESGAGHSLVNYDLIGRTNLWRATTVGSSTPGFASLIKAGDKLIVLTERGELVVLQPGTTYNELGRYKALNQYCWNQPTVVDGRLYARSSAEIIALDMALPTVALPAIQLAVQPDDTRSNLNLVLRSATGTALDAAAAARLQLQSTEDGGVTWLAVPAALTPVADALEITLPLSGNGQLLRVREKAPAP